MVAVEWSLALMGWVMAVHSVEVQVQCFVSCEADGRCDGRARRARGSRFCGSEGRAHRVSQRCAFGLSEPCRRCGRQRLCAGANWRAKVQGC